MCQKKCVHIIAIDKFTSGYINFLRLNNMGWKHTFITFVGNFPLENNDDLYIVANYKEVVRKYKQCLIDADKIVVASYFNEALSLLLLPKKVWKKIYIQFWGGDIYRFKNKKHNLIAYLKQEISRILVRCSIKKAAGVLTLVDGDYNELLKVFNIKNIKHSVVQVPDDFYEINHFNYEKIVGNLPANKRKRILIGNSATIENGHLEIFNLLKDKTINDFDIVVPLSYGDDAYRKAVIDNGNSIFKDNFLPIVNFMKREEYIRLLASCDVAIFNNNRQQATGNIIILANLGKKIYLRDDTSMWSFFEQLGFKFHKVSDIAKESLVELIEPKANEKRVNYIALKKMENEAVNQWRSFLN